MLLTVAGAALSEIGVTDVAFVGLVLRTLLAERIRRRVADHETPVDGHPVRVTVSVGAFAAPVWARVTRPAATWPPLGSAFVAGAVCANAVGTRNAAVRSTARESGK